jgi:hypothetical protein
VLSVPHTDPAHHRCGTQQLFLPEVPACAAISQVEAPKIERLIRLSRHRNAAATRGRLNTADGHEVLSDSR